MFDKLIADLGNMDKTVLMNADIHKCAEIDHIPHGSFEDHAFFQIFHIQHVGAEHRLRHFIPGVSGRFLQLLHNIPESDLTDPQFLRRLLIVPDLAGNPGKFPLRHILRRISQLLQKSGSRIVCLRMYTGGVQRVLSPGDPHKARALLERLWSQLRHLEKITAAFKSAVLFPVNHDILRDHLADSGNIFQKRRGSSIQIHSHLIHTVLHHSGKGFSQLLLVHIMLILSHSYGTGIDLHQLRQRILQTSGNGSGASLPHVKIGELLCSQLTGGIHRGSRLIGDHIGNLFRDLFQKIHNDLLGFS